MATPTGQITEDEWDDFFKHIPNPVDGSMIWDYSDTAQMEALRKYPDNQHWTLTDDDGGQTIGTGIHFVNRVGYCVTEQPWGDEQVWAFIPDMCSECGEREVVEDYDYEFCSTCGPLMDEDEDEDDEEDGAPCCPDPECGGNPCTFPGYADNH